jgi:D-3-phosphoglycerate dehydrogenase
VSDLISRRRRVGVVAEQQAIDRTFSAASLARLEAVADVSYCVFDAPDIRLGRYADAAPSDPERDAALKAFVADLDALIVTKGSPRITGAIMDAAPQLCLVGDLQGDRFARRIDVEAARERGIVAVDTTNGSSDPVAEWALGLSLIGLRNAGALFRRYLAGELIFADRRDFREDPGYLRGELTGKTVGLVACGYIGRRLIELLRPFRADVLVYDPYIPRVLADVYDMTITSLENVMSLSDVVVVLAPLTERTKGLVGAAQLALLKPGAVFVNVSRGPVVDSDALIERLREGDVIACLDVFDPEPVPVDSPLRTMQNVFLSPHIAGVTAECGPRFFDLMVDEVLRAFAGHETRHSLTPREDLA